MAVEGQLKEHTNIKVKHIFVPQREKDSPPLWLTLSLFLPLFLQYHRHICRDLKQHLKDVMGV